MSTTSAASATLTMCLMLSNDFIQSSFSLRDMELVRFSTGKPNPQTHFARAQKEA
jgi:hypothetical protein